MDVAEPCTGWLAFESVTLVGPYIVHVIINISRTEHHFMFDVKSVGLAHISMAFGGAHESSK
jgi:hypothetical protein